MANLRDSDVQNSQPRMGELDRDNQDKKILRKNFKVQRKITYKFSTAPTPDGNLVYAERYGTIRAWRKRHGLV